MTYLLAVVAGIGFVEILLRSPLPRAIRGLGDTAGRAAHVVRSARISDHWKEKVLLAYSGRLLRSTATIGLCLVVAAVPLLLAVLIGNATGADVAGFIMSLPGLAVLTLVALAYAGLRSRLGAVRSTGAGDEGPRSDYGFGARLLHRLALGSDAVAEASFDIEQASRAKAGPVPDAGPPVFVAGLARAGTTVLMRALHSSGAFCSLTYRDMPFVLAPNLWRRLSSGSRRDAAARERAHGDGLAVDFDSPEALEEVFWRVFCGDRYIAADRLVPMTADAEEVDRFRAYVAAIRAGHGGPSGPTRYLSKNNNNILRLSSLNSAFPGAQVLIPFREPLQHAASLQRQHQRFTRINAEDPFSRRYMGWLVHHEFGADHRPFVFGDSVPGGSPDTLDYWLALWIDTYTALIETAPPACRFVCYESLCEDPAVWPSLCAWLSLAKPWPDPGFVRSRTAIEAPYDVALSARADALYQALRDRASAAWT